MLGSGLAVEALASLREVRVTLNPPETVKMRAVPAFVLVIGVPRKANFLFHIQAMNSSSSIDKHKIEGVTIVRRNHCRT